MTREQGRKEVVYQMTMSAARRMLEKGLITEEQYQKYDTKMRQKYAPIIGTLWPKWTCYSADSTRICHCERRWLYAENYKN